MWSRSYSKIAEGLNTADVWPIWTDVNQWHTWQDDIDHASMSDEFRDGGKFRFKPKGGPDLTLELTDVRPLAAFTDVTRFPLARMYDTHELVDGEHGVEIRTTIRMEGPLSFVWRKLVAEGVVAGLPAQTDKLIAKVRHG